MFQPKVSRFAGVKADDSVESYVLAALGANGTCRMGNNDRISTGSGIVEFIGWRHMSPELRKKLLGPTVVRVIVDHWYGEGKLSNIKGALRLLRLFEVAPDDSEASFQDAWKKYKAGVDPDAVPATNAASTTEDLAQLLKERPGITLAEAMAELERRKAVAILEQKDAARASFAKIKGRKVRT